MTQTVFQGVPVPGGTYTADQFAQLDRPPCPVCGAPVTFKRCDVTTRQYHERTGQRQYIAGVWSCPHACDPVAGKRRHYQQWATHDAVDGYGFRCSCGFEEHGIPDKRIAELRAEHVRD